MHESTNLKTEMYNAGYLDGLQDHTPHPNPTEAECYAVGYDNGFMERYGMTWPLDGAYHKTTVYRSGDMVRVPDRHGGYWLAEVIEQHGHHVIYCLSGDDTNRAIDASMVIFDDLGEE